MTTLRSCALPWSNILPLLTLFQSNVNSTERSAKRLAELCSSEAPPGPSGSYISMGKVTEPSKEALDGARSAELWRASQELVDSV